LIIKDSEIGGKVLTIPCMAHQTNLLVKKIVNSSIFEPIIKMLLIIINHFRNSNLALAKLRELSQNPNLTPQYPCITRWATFSKAAETILSLKDNIRVSIMYIKNMFIIINFNNLLYFFIRLWQLLILIS
jgi:hypothetical protein